MNNHNPSGDTAAFPRILYVDPHPSTRELMALFLEYAGHRCVAVASSVEAVERLRRDVEKFRLVIATHQPPEIDALALARELRAKMFCGAIMIQSFELDESDELDCRTFGVDAVLRNPTSGTVFLQKVAALCGQ